MKKIILASASPRRRELLKMIDIPFTVFPANVDEVIDDSLSPQENVMNLAKIKALHIAKVHRDAIIIGSDTIVVLDQCILGKPANADEAIHMLQSLSGKTHIVITGMTLLNNTDIDNFYSETKVTFYNLSEKEIQDYVATNEPFDKAGAYAIQGKGAKFIQSIEGDYYTVMGLPIGQLYQKLKRLI